jgi:hypothetical protein
MRDAHDNDNAGAIPIGATKPVRDALRRTRSQDREEKRHGDQGRQDA